MAHKIANENAFSDLIEDELTGKNFHVLMSYKEIKLDRESNHLINVDGFMDPVMRIRLEN